MVFTATGSQGVSVYTVERPSGLWFGTPSFRASNCTNGIEVFRSRPPTVLRFVPISVQRYYGKYQQW